MELFYEITILLVISAGLALIFRLIKQPAVLAYILAGILIASQFLYTQQGKEVLETMAKFGVTLLLFLLGLELKFSELRTVGRISLITGIGQIIFTVLIGLGITTLMGFNLVEALFVSIAITFSSTIVIVKLLSDKKEVNSLHGKISIGFLLVQDFCAIIALVILSSIGSSSGAVTIWDIFFVLAKAFFVFAIVVVLSQHVFPQIVKYLSRSHELLFLSAIAWAFGFASLASLPFFGFTIEIGGFLAGLALANSVESTQIISRVKSLRDFFILIFFVTLGASLSFGNLGEVIVPALILSFFVLIGNPIIVIVLLRLLGYKIRTCFLSGLTVAQISEFSLILTIVGYQANHVRESTLAMLTIIAAITFTISTYMIMNNERLYLMLEPFLKRFDVKNFSENFSSHNNIKGHIVVVGAHRMGQSIIDLLPKESLVIVDFDPDKIEDLQAQGFQVVFGDISDPDVLEKARVEHADVVISTVPSFEENLTLSTFIKNLKGKKPKLILTAHNNTDKEDLLKAGADEVVLPYTVSGEVVGRMVKKGVI